MAWKEKSQFPLEQLLHCGKKDVLVVSFNLVRPAGVLMYAVCSFCCCTPSRQLGYLVGLFVHTEVYIVVFAGKWVLNESCPGRA